MREQPKGRILPLELDRKRLCHAPGCNRSALAPLVEPLCETHYIEKVFPSGAGEKLEKANKAKPHCHVSTKHMHGKGRSKYTKKYFPGEMGIVQEEIPFFIPRDPGLPLWQLAEEPNYLKRLGIGDDDD
jgi:hypothetical protein